MRVKTDEKRKEIIEAASAVFEEKGYQGASMSAISARLGGSKATLYGYFKSKEELFVATIHDAVEPVARCVFETLQDVDGEPREVLSTFGRRYLEFIMMPEILILFRTGTAGGIYQSLGPMLYELGPRHTEANLVVYFREQQDRGRISVPHPAVSAAQFRSLVEAGIIEPLLFGMPPNQTVAEAVEHAVDTFLAAHRARCTVN